MIVEGWRSEVRDLLARVPDGGLGRLASHCFDYAAKDDGQVAVVVGLARARCGRRVGLAEGEAPGS